MDPARFIRGSTCLLCELRLDELRESLLRGRLQNSTEILTRSAWPLHSCAGSNSRGGRLLFRVVPLLHRAIPHVVFALGDLLHISIGNCALESPIRDRRVRFRSGESVSLLDQKPIYLTRLSGASIHSHEGPCALQLFSM